MTELNGDVSPIILGPFDPINNNVHDNLSFTKLLLDDATRKELIASGFKYALLDHWVSNLDLQKVLATKQFLKVDQNLRWMLQVVSFPRAYLYDISTHIYFDQEFRNALFQERKIVHGHYLRILLASKSLNLLDSLAYDEMDRIIAQIQMILGVSSAKARLTRQLLDLEGDRTSAHSRKHVFFDDTRDGSDPSAIFNFAENKDQFQAFDLLPEDARVLLSNAFLSPTPWQRFILLWFAIEAILGANGKQREEWCNSLACGKTINAEMIRLRNKRVKQAHYGSTHADDFDCISAMWIIRLACIKEPSLSIRISTAYAEWIDKQESNLGTRPRKDEAKWDIRLDPTESEPNIER